MMELSFLQATALSAALFVSLLLGARWFAGTEAAEPPEVTRRTATEGSRPPHRLTIGTVTSAADRPTAEQRRPPDPSRVICWECGADNERGYRYCRDCASPLPGGGGDVSKIVSLTGD